MTIYMVAINLFEIFIHITKYHNEHIVLGLPETAVDSEEEDDESCPSHDSYHELKDSVRECLEKEPSERNSDDLCILLVNFFLFLSTFIFAFLQIFTNKNLFDRFSHIFQISIAFNCTVHLYSFNVDLYFNLLPISLNSRISCNICRH